MTEPTGRALHLDGLARSYDGTPAVREVHLDVAPGEFVVLLGPSGCGKSTLLRMVAGLVAPDAGTVTLGGRDITHLQPRERDVAMVFQSYALYPHLSVERNIGLPLKVAGVPRRDRAARVAEAADLLDLGALLGRRPRELSGGQRQRVALARAMVREPQAFLMDEPLSNLDATLRTQTRAELGRLHRRLGTTTLYVTHDQVEAMTLADRIVLLRDGRVEQVGTPADVHDRPASTFVATFLGAPPMGLVDCRATGTPDALELRGPGVRVDLPPAGEVGRDVVLGVRPEALRPASPADDGGPRLEATVDLVELLGGEEVALCDVGPGRVAVRGPRPLGLRSGDHVVLTADPAAFHLFDATSRRRLERAAVPTAPPVPTA